MLSEATLEAIITQYLDPAALRAWLGDHLDMEFEAGDDTECPLARFLTDRAGEPVYVQNGYITPENANGPDDMAFAYVPGWAEHFIEQIDEPGEGVLWSAAEVIALIDAQDYVRHAADGYIHREPGITDEL